MKIYYQKEKTGLVVYTQAEAEVYVLTCWAQVWQIKGDLEDVRYIFDQRCIAVQGLIDLRFTKVTPLLVRLIPELRELVEGKNHD